MITRAYTVAFQGIEARQVEVQCAVTAGLPAFSIVGLPDKAVSEARDRVRTALSAMAIALPSKRITINLSPADLPKVGSHFDLPIAVALLCALEIIPPDVAETHVAFGELSLDGTLVPVIGALPAAMAAAEQNRGYCVRLNLGPKPHGSATPKSSPPQPWAIWCATLPANHRSNPPNRAKLRKSTAPKTSWTSKAKNMPNARLRLPPLDGTT